jgi:transketolase
MSQDIRDAFFEVVAREAKNDTSVVILTNDMEVFALAEFREKCQSRYIDVGVAEQNLINVAAGIASTGRKVIVFGLLSFITARAFEQIKLNVCAMRLPVVLVGIGPGLSFPFDGPSHHGISDIGLMKVLPELTILNPSDSITAKRCAELALSSSLPVYVRIDKGIHEHNLSDLIHMGEGFDILREPRDVNIIYTGTVYDQAMALLNKLQNSFQEVGLMNLFQVKPLPDGILKVIVESKTIYVIEENSKNSGLSSIIGEYILENQLSVKLVSVALTEKTIFEYGDRDWLKDKYGLGEINY